MQLSLSLAYLLHTCLQQLWRLHSRRGASRCSAKVPYLYYRSHRNCFPECWSCNWTFQLVTGAATGLVDGRIAGEELLWWRIALVKTWCPIGEESSASKKCSEIVKTRFSTDEELRSFWAQHCATTRFYILFPLVLRFWQIDRFNAHSVALYKSESTPLNRSQTVPLSVLLARE